VKVLDNVIIGEDFVFSFADRGMMEEIALTLSVHPCSWRSAFPETGGKIMIELDWRERISIDPKVCHGKLGNKGTRIMVSIALSNMPGVAEGRGTQTASRTR